jgi:predicted cupin superfamily sugar epimerase
MKEVEKIIKKLELHPHPEGGYYRETYRSNEEIAAEDLAGDYSGDRSVSTCIYFLLTSDTFSAFHRIRQDEIWHFYTGSPIDLHVISEAGVHSKHVIGNRLDKNESPQFVVRGGNWFAAEMAEENSYALVGCTVAPGFDFSDFVLPSRQELQQKFPEHSDLIRRFSRFSPHH